MDNTKRVAIYTRDRTDLTPAQRRRVRHRANAAQAATSRPLRRRARRDVVNADIRRSTLLRAAFRRMRGAK